MAIFTTIVTTMTVMGLITAGANTAGTIHDKSVIDESLMDMRNQATILQNQADKEANLERKRAKLRIAESLSQTEQTLSQLNESSYNRKLSEEAFNLGTGLLTPDVPGAKDLDGVVSGVQDTVMAAKASAGEEEGVDMKMWRNMANTGSDADIAILIAKARAMRKEMEEVGSQVETKYKELKELEEQEKRGEVDYQKVEEKLAEIVNEDKEFKSRLLGDAEDSISDLDTQQESTPTIDASEFGLNEYEPVEETQEPEESPEINLVGKWLIYEYLGTTDLTDTMYEGSYYLFKEDGTAEHCWHRATCQNEGPIQFTSYTYNNGNVTMVDSEGETHEVFLEEDILYRQCQKSICVKWKKVE
ncbi:hypothetical protein GF362_00880 [Candidatus Dojkabacteria bacterium]|nr:hypothetical protein [Candidatus Dojkabacteria bacterium]